MNVSLEVLTGSFQSKSGAEHKWFLFFSALNTCQGFIPVVQKLSYELPLIGNAKDDLSLHV